MRRRERRASAPAGLEVADGIESWGIRAAWTGAVGAAAAQLVDFGVYGLRIRLLDMETHASVFGAASLLALAATCCAATLLVAAGKVRTPGAVALAPLLAVLLALRVLYPPHVVVIALPFVAATFVVLWWGLGAMGAPVLRTIRVGCATLVGSYGVHVFGGPIVSALGYGAGTWPDQITLAVQHSGELAGWIIVATGLAAAYAAGRIGEAPSPGRVR